MNTIQPVQEVFSLFGVGLKTKALKKHANYHLAVSLISAFFIVLAAAWILSYLSGAGSVAAPVKEEKTAYQPGKFISQYFDQAGYVRR